MRVRLEPSWDGELEAKGVSELLDSLAKAFGELGEQLLKSSHEPGEVDALAELNDALRQSYEARLDAIKREILEAFRAR